MFFILEFEIITSQCVIFYFCVAVMFDTYDVDSMICEVNTEI